MLPSLQQRRCLAPSLLSHCLLPFLFKECNAIATAQPKKLFFLVNPTRHEYKLNGIGGSVRLALDRPAAWIILAIQRRAAAVDHDT